MLRDARDVGPQRAVRRLVGDACPDVHAGLIDAQARFVEIARLSRISLAQTLAAIVDMEIEQRLMLHRMDPVFFAAYRHSFDVHRRVDELTVGGTEG